MTSERNGESPEITPQVVHLIDLLKWAREGRLRVPRFQRDFVWRRQDIVDLFDSIASQYPIGTLFLWGSDPMPDSRDHIGPLKLPDYPGQTWLVLDGQQRLTTLVGVLLREGPGWSDRLDKDDPARWHVFFDARPGEGGFFHLAADEPQAPHHLPVLALLDTIRLFTEVGRMMKEAGPEAEAWVNRAQEVARAIQSYRVPIVQFATNNLSIAVESFSRLNKKGRSIGQDEMFSALTYEENNGERFHLATEIDKLQQAMIRSGFGRVDRTILLRAVLTAADLDMYRTDWTRISQQLRVETRQKLPTAVEEAERGLDRSRDFLRELGILNVRMLPYSMQLVALSAFFGTCDDPSEAQKKLLKRWFWSSSFAGWFGSGNPSRSRRLVQELHDQLPKDKNPQKLLHMDLNQQALPIPLRFDLRSARVRALICILLHQPPMRPNGTVVPPEEAASLLLERGPNAMSKICATVSGSELGMSPANRILDVAPEARGQAKNWLLSLDTAKRDEVLISHAIPPEAYPFLQAGNHDEFLELRMKHLVKLERDFMEIAGVNPPSHEEASLSPLDTDDEAF